MAFYVCLQFSLVDGNVFSEYGRIEIVLQGEFSITIVFKKKMCNGTHVPSNIGSQKSLKLRTVQKKYPHNVKFNAHMSCEE